jgi:hypothetical protein
MKELEIFKNTMMSHKNELAFKKLEIQKNIIEKDLDNKTLKIKQDVDKLKLIKKENSNDVDKLYETFKKNLNKPQQQENDISSVSIINKIKTYCEKCNLSGLDLIKILDKTSITDPHIDLNEVHSSFLKLNILTEEESQFFIDLLKIYNDSSLIKIETFLYMLEEKSKEGEEKDCLYDDYDMYKRNDNEDYE